MCLCYGADCLTVGKHADENRILRAVIDENEQKTRKKNEDNRLELNQMNKMLLAEIANVLYDI